MTVRLAPVPEKDTANPAAHSAKTLPAAQRVSIDPLDYALKAAAVKRLGRKRRRVVFLIHACEIFSALEPVIEELQLRSDRFELIFIALPRNYSGRVGACGNLKETRDFLDARGLQPLSMKGLGVGDLVHLVQLAPDFIFRQTPWEHHIPPVFGSRLLGFAQLCYVPYGMATVERPQEQYNQPFHNQCDLIFVESQYHFERYAQHRALRSAGLVLTGYPRFEGFVRLLEQAQPAWPLPCSDDTPRVLWAPHHSVEQTWLNYSTFLDHKDRMLAEAQRGRISILLRPHPALAEKLAASGAMTGEAYGAYLAAFEACRSSGVDRAATYIDQFAASDLLITDGLGFFSEYLLTGKPLVRTWKAGAEPMNAFGEWCAEAARVVRDGAQLQTVLDEIGERCYRDDQLELRLQRRELLMAMCVGASARIADALEGA